MGMIKTRFAPSPTGELHIGSARTALFAYLFAKHNDGEFLLRIEDTDQARSTKEFEENIFAGLDWLGLSHDGEVLYQSSRLAEYRNIAKKLVEDSFAIEKDGAIILQAKEALGKLGIKYEEVEKITSEGKNSGEKSYLVKDIGTDLIHGQISGTLSDTVLLRSDGTPTFHLAVVIDDEFMGITHVVRGDDHLSNTPLHIVLQKALGYKVLEYAHIPMILGTDRSKLSKRHGATSVLEYKKQGYLPEALVNFMALLGWNPKDEREIFSLEELTKKFDLKNVNKAGAVFDIEKLKWMNKHYLMALTQDAIKNSLKEFNVYSVTNGEADLLRRGDFATLKNGAEYILKLRLEPEYDFAKLIFKKSNKEATVKGLELSLEKLSDLGDWDANGLTATLDEVVVKGDLQKGDVFWPIRFALCGEDRSPSPVELLLALGKEKSIERISKAINDLKK